MRRLVFAVLTFTVGFAAVHAVPARAAGSAPLAIGAPAPRVSEPTLAGGTFDSATSGKPYLVEFFAV